MSYLYEILTMIMRSSFFSGFMR